MSPRPTRLNRPDVGTGRQYVCACRQRQGSQIWRPVGDGERASLGSITRDDLRQARVKTAIGNLARVFESRHVN